jgi:hypothetical protein
MSDVTQILSAIEQGDPSAAEQLLPLVYDELRKLARDPLRLVGQGACGGWLDGVDARAGKHSERMTTKTRQALEIQPMRACAYCVMPKA